MNPTKITPKDFFLHLGATVALYVVVGSFINLAFSVINYFRPDQLAGYFYANSVAWPISMLIVLVPAVYTLEWLINRDISRSPDRADVWIRRWRIYLTLFLAVILIGGDLIALINTYLNGEITSRFVYKALVVLFVGGLVGKYYFFSLYPQFKLAKFTRRFNAWAGIVLVIVAIVFGFVAVGSPATQRAIRFDNQRISDLSNIQWRVISHWQNKGALPSDLSDLRDDIAGYFIPTDPETKSQYEYSTTWIPSMSSNPTFALCATFSRATQDLKGRGAYGGGGGVYYARDMAVSYPYPGPDMNDSWDHETGRTSFDRTIDPDIYPANRSGIPTPLKY